MNSVYMKRIILLIAVALFFSCKKESVTEPEHHAKTLLKLSFYDEFTTNILDSVTFSVTDGNKTYTLTRDNPYVKGLPKGPVQARISKKGFITQDYKIDFTKRDTINDNIILKYDRFILDVPQDSLFASKNRKKFAFEVRRNSGFVIEKPEWVKVDTTAISKFMVKIDVTVLQHDGIQNRNGEIVFKHGESRRIIPVLQYRKNQIVTAYANVNERLSIELDMIDQFEGFPSISKLGDRCLSEIRYELVEGKKINFSTGCVNLLVPMAFKIMVKNKGGLDTLDFNVKFYDKKIDFNENRENYKYLTQTEPGKLYFSDDKQKKIGIIDIEDFLVEKKLNVAAVANQIVFNGYNKSYYLLSDDDKLRKINMQTGALSDAVTIPVDPINDHPQLPYTIPTSLVFNKNGLGFMVTLGNGISGNGYRTIDTKNNNKIGIPTELHQYDTQSADLLPNGVDFFFNTSYNSEYVEWNASSKKVSNFPGRLTVLHYKNWVFDDNNNLIDYNTKQTIASSLPFTSSIIDKSKELLYGWSYKDSQMFISQMDAKGNLIGRIPSYYYEFRLSLDGKYLIVNDEGRGDLYRVNTAVFKGKYKVEDWK
ncbi:hypothetical protein EDF66_103169 [Sphingobacterium sp. JUb20]|nr:hypothetical protein EDF66_103169 [Sphingobacterium sp. JUb20]